MCWESFVPEGPGAVVVGRIMSCSGVVLVPVGGLWRCPGAAHGLRGQAVPRSLFWGCGVGRVLSRQPLLHRSCRRRGSLQASDRWGFCTTRSLLTPCRRRVGPPCRAIPPDWRRRGRGSRRCGRQSADPLGKKSPKTVVLTEWICVLGATVSVVVCVLSSVLAAGPICWQC